MTTKFILLGCGSSMGVPRVDGYFGSCNPRNKKNYRSSFNYNLIYEDANEYQS